MKKGVDMPSVRDDIRSKEFWQGIEVFLHHPVEVKAKESTEKGDVLLPRGAVKPA